MFYLVILRYTQSMVACKTLTEHLLPISVQKFMVGMLFIELVVVLYRFDSAEECEQTCGDDSSDGKEGKDGKDGDDKGDLVDEGEF